MEKNFQNSFFYIKNEVKYKKKIIFFQSLHKYSQAFVDFGAVQHILYFIYQAEMEQV